VIWIIATDKTARETLHNCLEFLGHTGVRSCSVILGDCKDDVGEADTVIILWELADRNEQQGTGLDAARWLRSNPLRRCRGPIILLSFASIAYLKKKWNDSEVMNTKGVAVLRMPFLAKELQSVLEQTPALSEAEWKQVNHELRRNDLRKQATKLRHRADSLLSTTLTALFELEKLSYFQRPDPQVIRRHLTTIVTTIENGKPAALEQEVKSLLQEARSLGLSEATDRQSPPDGFVLLKQFVATLQSVPQDDNVLTSFCREAQGIRKRLLETLGFITRISKA
jgi:CheY-like chemotaxis protein